MNLSVTKKELRLLEQALSDTIDNINRQRDKGIIVISYMYAYALDAELSNIVNDPNL